MIHRRGVSNFGPALSVIVSSQDCCNSTDSNMIIVRVCSVTSSIALDDSKSCHVCNLMSPVSHSTTNQLKDLLLFPCIHYYRNQEHKSIHSCSGVGDSLWRGQAVRWEIPLGHPKWWRIRLQPPDSNGQALSGSPCLEMVVWRGKTAAYKRLTFSRTDNLSSYRLSWKRYIPEIKDGRKS